MIDNSKTGLLVSIVSHMQADQAKNLLDSFEKYCKYNSIAVILTLNAREDLSFYESDYSFPLFIYRNARQKGFGTNHNQAFALMKSDYYCVINPDVSFFEDPFPKLIDIINNKKAGVTAPLVYNSKGQLEDSARMLPTPYRLLKRILRRKNDYIHTKAIQEVDWVAGMFMLFKSDLFRQLNGFDERYNLYCEDIDICSRIWLIGKKVIWNNSVVIYHDAQRSSHNSLNYLKLHILSIIRLFCSSAYFKRIFQIYFRRKDAEIKII